LCLSFSFFKAAANDRGYVYQRFAGASLTHSDKVNMGANAA